MTADDSVLAEDGEAEAPASCWAIYTDDDAREVTVAVPPTSEADLSAVHAAALLWNCSPRSRKGE